MIFIKEKKPSRKKLKKMAIVKGNHKIVVVHPILDSIAERKRKRAEQLAYREKWRLYRLRIKEQLRLEAARRLNLLDCPA